MSVCYYWINPLRRCSVNDCIAERSIELSIRSNAFPRLTDKAQVNKVIDTLGEYNKLGVTHVLCEMNIPAQQPRAVMLETME